MPEIIRHFLPNSLCLTTESVAKRNEFRRVGLTRTCRYLPGLATTHPAFAAPAQAALRTYAATLWVAARKALSRPWV